MGEGGSPDGPRNLSLHLFRRTMVGSAVAATTAAAFSDSIAMEDPDLRQDSPSTTSIAKGNPYATRGKKRSNCDDIDGRDLPGGCTHRPCSVGGGGSSSTVFLSPPPSDSAHLSDENPPVVVSISSSFSVGSWKKIVDVTPLKNSTRHNREVPPSAISSLSSNASGACISTGWKTPAPFRFVPIRNPYTKKLSISDEEELPEKLETSERFYAALLRSSPQAFVDAHEHDSKSRALWGDICARVGITDLPTSGVKSCYEDPEEHFNARCALVLEEARYSVSKGLADKWVCHGLVLENRHKPTGMPVVLRRQQPSASNNDGSTRHKILTFAKCGSQGFSFWERTLLRNGAVLDCLPIDRKHQASQVVLCRVLTCSRERIECQKEFDVMVFTSLPEAASKEGSLWTIGAVDLEMINNLGKFVAVTEMVPKEIPFLNALLGFRPESTEEPTVTPPSCNRSQPSELNLAQERAATAFLSSPPKSITIVQGPPGTGKTTLLVNIMRRCMAVPTVPARRILVSAPTNEAIRVLATRFLSRIEDDEDINVVVTGYKQKLIGKSEDSADTSPLKPFFADETWLQCIVERYTTIADFFHEPKQKCESDTKVHLWKTAVRLQKRLARNLRGLPPELTSSAVGICTMLQTFKDGGSIQSDALVALVERVVTVINSLDTIAVQRELMAAANIIFCTLASSGNPVVKQMPPVNDLIVDEAAAASEPELYIPFHLKPSRLLLVGDPKQLPATVCSPHAVALGLAMSLHERLMYRCNHDYIMLNQQYRMHPSISAFPSEHFYNGRILDGSNVTHPSYSSSCRGPTFGDGVPYTCLQVAGVEQRAGESMRNAEEANVILDLVIKLVNSADSKSWSPDRIRIITFYRAQVDLIRQKLRSKGLEKVLVTTVDSSQGSESDIVIVSFVRSVSPGFTQNKNRLNVALTRAKHQLVCVGNFRAFTRMNGKCMLRVLSTDASKREVTKSWTAIREYTRLRRTKRIKVELP